MTADSSVKPSSHALWWVRALCKPYSAGNRHSHKNPWHLVRSHLGMCSTTMACKNTPHKTATHFHVQCPIACTHRHNTVVTQNTHCTHFSHPAPTWDCWNKSLPVGGTAGLPGMSMLRCWCSRVGAPPATPRQWEMSGKEYRLLHTEPCTILALIPDSRSRETRESN